MIASRLVAGAAALGFALLVAAYPAPPAGAGQPASPTPTDSGSPLASGSPTLIASPSPSGTPHFRLTVTPAPLRRRSPSPSPSPSPTPTPTETPTPSPTPKPTKTPKPTPTPKPSATAKPSATPKPSPTPTPTPRPTRTPRPTPTPRVASTPTAIATTRPTPTLSPTDVPTEIPTAAPSGRATSHPNATLRPLPANGRTVRDALQDPSLARTLARPIGELSAFGWMAGTWRAHQVQREAAGKARDLGMNTYIFAFTMKNRWLFGADGKAQDQFYITFDPIARQYVLVRLAADPSYGIWVSTQGWRGNGIAFTSGDSYAYGHPYHRRVTIVRKDARTFTIFDEEQLSDGTWSADDTVELSKQ